MTLSSLRRNKTGPDVDYNNYNPINLGPCSNINSFILLDSYKIVYRICNNFDFGSRNSCHCNAGWIRNLFNNIGLLDSTNTLDLDCNKSGRFGTPLYLLSGCLYIPHFDCLFL